MVTPTTRRIVTPDGIGLAVHSWGGDGPPVLLCHPTGFHGRVWAPAVEPLLAAGRTVYSLDFRGHGDSDAPAPDPECRNYAWHHFGADVLAVVDHLGIAGAPGFVAAGHSKGAAAILLAEVERPGAFPAVWAFEPIVFPDDVALEPQPDFSLAVGARKRRNEWASPDEAYTSYASRPPLSAMTPESLRAYVDYGFRDRGDGVWELKCHPHVEACVYSMGPNHGLFRRLDEVGSRVLVGTGEQSDAIGPRAAAAIMGRVSGATLEVWEGHGHFGPQADPERAAQSILAFARA